MSMGAVCLLERAPDCIESNGFPSLDADEEALTCAVCGKPSSLAPTEYRGPMPFRCRECRPGSVGHGPDGRRFVVGEDGQRRWEA